MGIVAAAETIGPSSRARARAAVGQSEFLRRWLVVWVVLLTVVTVVVVVFLTVITGSLSSITKGLETADAGVLQAGGDVRDLPDQIDAINASLEGIDPALKPIRQSTEDIRSALTSIDTKLKRTDGSLKDTSAMLKGILGQANNIRGMLVDADDPPDKLGVQNIHQRVAHANGVGNQGFMGTNPHSLTAAKADAASILGGLVDTNMHLRSICNSEAVGAQASRPRRC